MTQRLCYALDLHDDPALIAGYDHWHRPGGPPAAVIRAIRASGIEALEIWRTGPRLFMIMEVNASFSPQAKARADAADPDVQAWETLMWTFQKALPAATPGEKWATAARIFDLAQQP